MTLIILFIFYGMVNCNYKMLLEILINQNKESATTIFNRINVN